MVKEGPVGSQVSAQSAQAIDKLLSSSARISFLQLRPLPQKDLTNAEQSESVGSRSLPWCIALKQGPQSCDSGLIDLAGCDIVDAHAALVI